MSALAYLTEYGSDSDENDEEINKPKPLKLKLHMPNLNNVPVVSQDIYIDNPADHNGRIRSFPHIRGNWPSFVYVIYSKEEALQDLIDRIEYILHEELKDFCYKCDDFHISLSKTIVLQYHLITSFTKSLQECFSNIRSFDLGFSSVDVYCNEDNTRTFISLKADYYSKKALIQITHKVDSVLKEYKLPVFYEDPSFHMSLLWLNGNKKAEILPYLPKFNELLAEQIASAITPISIDALNCKIGNKYYRFSL